MERPGRARAGRALLGAALLGGLAACHVPSANHWNLQQVHEADGTPRRVGILRNGLQQAFAEALEASDFGVPSFAADEARVIEDPLGTCLDNLCALFDAGLGEAQTRALMVDALTWLSGDCTYVLSRERCALVLAALGLRYGLDGPLAEPTEGVAGVEEVRAAYETLKRDALPVIARQVARAPELAAHCDAARALVLDRAGGRRLFRATAALLERDGFENPELAPLADLHRDLGRRCLGLALGALLADEEALVRAAAVRSWIELTAGRDPLPYRAALEDGDPLALLEAARGMIRHGVPGRHEADGELPPLEVWSRRLVNVLSAVPDGRLTVACCRALARLHGRPENLRPEHWISWWLEREAEHEAAAPAP